jgi:OOP family OmpA-OmpF porin
MRKKKVLVAFAATLLATAGVRADDSGFYLGASVGEATQSSDGFDGEDTSFRLLGGYSLNRNFALEAGYVDGGKQEDTNGSLDLSVKSDGFFATVLAKLPLGDAVTPYVKFGYVVYDSTATVSNGSMRVSETTSDEDILYGVGVEFRLGENFRLRADYEKPDVPDVAFDIYSIVASFHF